MHVDLNPPFMFFMHYLSILLALSVAMHFINLLSLSYQLTSRANLGPVSTFTKASLRNLEKEGSPSSLDLQIWAHHQPPRLNSTFLKLNGCLAQKFVQICP